MTRLFNVSPTKPASVVHFDWMTTVLPLPVDCGDRYGLLPEEYVKLILKKLNLGKGDLVYSPMKNGIYTYDRAMCSGGNSIIVGWYDKVRSSDLKLPEGHDTFMIQISGTGLETIESVLDKRDKTLFDLIKELEALNASFSRIDACCDFFNYPKEYSARYVAEQAEKGNLITTSKRVKIIHSFDSSGAREADLEAYQGSEEGYTLYIGRNPKQMRVYNKLAERADKVNLLYQVKSWVRWEYQLNGVQAMAFMDALRERDYDLVQTWIDWLVSNYRFIERVGHQAKRSRYPNATWYDDLIKTAKEKIMVRSERQKPTFERSEKWIKKQVMPTLATIYFARYNKYIQNGVSEADAERLALEKIKQDIEDELVLQNIDWSSVYNYIKEMS